MSRSGMIAAADQGAQLPKFGSLAEAEVTLYRERDRLLAQLTRFARESNGLDCTFHPDSLKALEIWYFRLLDEDAFRAPVMSRFEFERCIAVYFGEVLVRSSPPFEWFVSEYAFQPGRYELGSEGRSSQSCSRARWRRIRGNETRGCRVCGANIGDGLRR